MLELFDGRAETITSAITQFLADVDLPLQEMVAFGSDGASVMVGRKGGVSTLLRNQVLI